MDLKDAIREVVDRQSLTEAEAHAALGVIMDGEATPAQVSPFITALRMKGETVDEIAGFARAMRERAQRIRPRVADLVDVGGTGGDRGNPFNIPPPTAFVVAGAGAYVAKHGNRAVSRRSGAADVLEALGVNIQVGPEVVEGCIEDIGIGFLFAPLYHAAMKHAVGPRKEIGIRSVFNILGPLPNPAGARHCLVGTYDPGLTEIMAEVLSELGARRALVVLGEGMNELSTLGPTKVSEVMNGSVRTYALDPTTLGITPPDPRALAGRAAGGSRGSREGVRGGGRMMRASIAKAIPAHKRLEVAGPQAMVSPAAVRERARRAPPPRHFAAAVRGRGGARGSAVAR